MGRTEGGKGLAATNSMVPSSRWDAAMSTRRPLASAEMTPWRPLIF